MSKVFISYRRKDSMDITGRIYDRLCLEYGKKNVFKDVHNISYGVDFRDAIREAIDQCDVMLVVLGDEWSNGLGKEGNLKLHTENDYVRIEIEAGLKKGIPIIPVLVNNASMPKITDLPECLYKLVYLNALSIKEDPYFTQGTLKLFSTLNDILGKKPKKNKWLHYLLGIIITFGVIAYMYITKLEQVYDFLNLYPEKVINKKVEDREELVVYTESKTSKNIESVIDIPEKQNKLNLKDFILKIGTIPKNAKVTLLNKNMDYKWGMTLPKGKYRALVQRKGYHNKEFDINLNKNIYKKVQLRRQTYTLKIIPNISGATVRIMNIIPTYTDNIRLNGNIKYTIHVSKEGYHSKYFTLKPLNENTTLRVSLKKRKEKKKYFTLKIKPIYKGKFISTNSKGVSVKILNTGPKYKDNIRLRQGVYDVLVTKRGCQPRRFNTYLRSNESIPVKLCK